MEPSFWHERWSSGRIAFHEGRPNALMEKHVRSQGAPRGRIFLPLCGKAVDLAWLAAQGFEVVGAELDPLAVEAFFKEQGLTATVQDHGALKEYAAAGITIWQGDIFALTAAQLGEVTAVYDRAALVALPPEMRVDYAAHLAAITGRAPQLLITFEYDNPSMEGPPHSVPAEEVHAHYDAAFTVEELERRDITGPLLNRTTGAEVAWKLTPR